MSAQARAIAIENRVARRFEAVTKRRDALHIAYATENRSPPQERSQGTSRSSSQQDPEEIWPGSARAFARCRFQPPGGGRQTTRSELPPTSDRIPGSVPASDLLHAHKWKRGAEETTVTTREMIKKASRIAPAYNKGALQYLPSGIDREQWPSRQDASGKKPHNGRRESR